MSKYNSYKNVSFGWIRNIPNHWNVKKMSWCYPNIGSGTTPKSSNEKFYEDGSVNWLLTGDLTDGFVKSTKKKITPIAIQEVSSLKLYPIESVVMAMYGATIGKLGILEIETTTNQACCVFPKSSDILNKYLFYWLLFSRNEIINLSYGGGQPNISQEVIKNLRITKPPISEQQQIVSYLDNKTGLIDSLIKKKQRKIKLLQEKRTSLINEVITKGLDPDVKMKDSRVEWIGEIPEKWNSIKLKYLGDMIIGITYKPFNVVEENKGVLVLRSSNIQNGKFSFKDNVYVDSDISDKHKTKLGDILICTRNGSRRLIGKNAMISQDLTNLTWGVFMTMFRSKYSNYLYWILNSPVFQSQSGSYLTSTINQLTINTLNNLEIPFSQNGKERDEIVNFLTLNCSEIDKLINLENKKIIKLKEYRQSLISDVVTGKIKVCEEDLSIKQPIHQE